MLRSFFVSLSKAQWAQRMVTHWGVARRAARRFVAGETTQDALQAISHLNQKGILATLDHLGENTSSMEEATESTAEVCQMLGLIAKSALKSNVSIKLSQIGLLLDEGQCRKNLKAIVETAASVSIFVRVDMEDSTVTEKTLEIVRSIHQLGFDNIGVVLQAYLYRTEKDLKRITSENVPVRLCKGAYHEPAQVAFPRKYDVDQNYDQLADILIAESLRYRPPQNAREGCFPPLAALATHDEKRIDHILTTCQKLGIPNENVEFQMLYGIRRDLQEKIAGMGFPVRVYVPYGTHWYPYFMRRLAERPANLWFFVSNFFRR